MTTGAWRRDPMSRRSREQTRQCISIQVRWMKEVPPLMMSPWEQASGWVTQSTWRGIVISWKVSFQNYWFRFFVRLCTDIAVRAFSQQVFTHKDLKTEEKRAEVKSKLARWLKDVVSEGSLMFLIRSTVRSRTRSAPRREGLMRSRGSCRRNLTCSAQRNQEMTLHHAQVLTPSCFWLINIIAINPNI